ncbi:hypothetical protein CsSME_00010984 [Camellia sinensis var. sinensis]
MGFTNAYIKTPCLLAEGGAQFLAQPSAKSINIEYNSELKLEKEREIMSSGRSIFDLPGHIITDILSRLPIKTIIHCRCVCRTWHSLVLDPHFANLHLSRTPTSLIIHQDSDRSPDWDSDILKLIEFDRDEHDQHGNGLLHYDPLMKFDLKRLCYKNGEILLVGSVNGLLCFCDYENEAIFICNPIMRECITLPKPMYTKRYPSTIVYGFGYSSLSGHYKVVQISQTPLSDPAEGLPSSYDSQGAVYVLGTANWRSIGTVPFLYSCRSYNLSLNGNIHWLNCDGETSELICSFDVEYESFQVFPSPPNNLIKQTLYVSLGLFRDCLCLCVTDGSEDSDIVIWVMKEYGVKESWTKEIVIRQNSSDLSCLLYDEVSLLHVWENGDILILWRDDRLYSYSPERKTLEEVEVPRDSSHIVAPFITYEMMLHVPSFLSLKDFEREKVDMF